MANQGSLGKKYVQTVAQEFETVDLIQTFELFKHDPASIGFPVSDFFNQLKHSSTGGKKIRAGLLQLGYELAGGKELKSISSMKVFIELFHAGLLMHDDIMDDDDTRRGSESFHKHFQTVATQEKIFNPPLYGTGMGILGGDAAFYITWSILAQSDFSDTVVRKVMSLYSRYATRLVYGQVLDINQQKLSHATKDSILKKMQLKTAEYTGVLPLEIGATLAEMDEHEVQKLRLYGLEFGWAFQVQDDIIGLFGETSKIGKTAGSDITEGKITLLMLALYELGTDQQKKRQLEILGKKDCTAQEIEEMKSMVTSSGALEMVQKQGWDHVHKAQEIASTITTTQHHKEVLCSLVAYMMERTL